MKTTLIVSAIVRSHDQVLMIEQPDDDKHLYWFIPGGVVEGGETLIQAVSREVKEETGLIIGGDERLAFVSQIYNAHDARQTLAFVFDIATYDGEINPDDPDQLTYQAAFVPVNEALCRLKQVKWAPMRDPLIAYLNKSNFPGCVWQYTENTSNVFELIYKSL